MWNYLYCVVEVVVLVFFGDDVLIDLICGDVVLLVCWMIGELFVVFKI